MPDKNRPYIVEASVVAANALELQRLVRQVRKDEAPLACSLTVQVNQVLWSMQLVGATPVEQYDIIFTCPSNRAKSWYIFVRFMADDQGRPKAIQRVLYVPLPTEADFPAHYLPLARELLQYPKRTES